MLIFVRAKSKNTSKCCSYLPVGGGEVTFTGPGRVSCFESGISAAPSTVLNKLWPAASQIKRTTFIPKQMSPDKQKSVDEEDFFCLGFKPHVCALVYA